MDSCKHEIEITIPVEDVAAETQKATEHIRSHAHLRGFRPGKAPLSMIRQNFAGEIRQEVLDKLLGRFFRKKMEELQKQVVGTPAVTDVQFEEGQPITFKAEYETVPEFELKDYRGVVVPYTEPVVDDKDVEARIELLRKQKADYVNLDPRPAEKGDIAVIDLESVGGDVDPPINAKDMQIELGGDETMPEFTENITGMEIEEEKVITVTYPEDYGEERLAGKTVKFLATLKMLQRRELPELNDEFAKDLGDFQTLDELKTAIRTNIFREREVGAQRKAKDAIMEKLEAEHDFPVPEAWVDRQIELYVERFVGDRGGDPRRMNLDMGRIKEAMRDRAVKEVKMTLLLDRISQSESIAAMKDEVDREIQRYAKQEREPVAAVRKRFDEDGTTERMANAIRNEKVLNFLFEHARKEAPQETPQESPES